MELTGGGFDEGVSGVDCCPVGVCVIWSEGTCPDRSSESSGSASSTVSVTCGTHAASVLEPVKSNESSSVRRFDRLRKARSHMVEPTHPAQRSTLESCHREYRSYLPTDALL